MPKVFRYVSSIACGPNQRQPTAPITDRFRGCSEIFLTFMDETGQTYIGRDDCQTGCEIKLTECSAGWLFGCVAWSLVSAFSPRCACITPRARPTWHSNGIVRPTPCDTRPIWGAGRRENQDSRSCEECTFHH